jgi:hypothetical protein
VNHRVVGEDLTTAVETIQMKNGYVAEFHDFQLQPNGHALVLCYYLSEVDMSQIVSGGNPAALVSGAVIQELDAQRNAVFQWRSWDHYDFETYTYADPTAATLSEFHVNDLRMDVDDHLIAGTPSEVLKINRQTGDVMWTLGGIYNEFTVVDGDTSIPWMKPTWWQRGSGRMSRPQPFRPGPRAVPNGCPTATRSSAGGCLGRGASRRLLRSRPLGRWCSRCPLMISRFSVIGPSDSPIPPQARRMKARSLNYRRAMIMTLAPRA